MIYDLYLEWNVYHLGITPIKKTDIHLLSAEGVL
jgi:hypothetical protein